MITCNDYREPVRLSEMRLERLWPNKIAGTDLKATGNEVAVETIVISHEGLTIANA